MGGLPLIAVTWSYGTFGSGGPAMQRHTMKRLRDVNYRGWIPMDLASDRAGAIGAIAIVGGLMLLFVLPSWLDTNPKRVNIENCVHNLAPEHLEFDAAWGWCERH